MLAVTIHSALHRYKCIEYVVLADDFTVSWMTCNDPYGIF